MIECFRDIPFPDNFKYKSDSEHIPLEFFEYAIPVSKSLDLLLGYFSTNAFKALSESLAVFIFKGGKIRLITNHYYSFNDYQNIIANTELSNEDKVITTLENLDEINVTFQEHGQHFFDCLKYLLKNKRLEVLPVKFQETELSHSKIMILDDGNDAIATNGSINFTLGGIIKNGEEFSVEAPWTGIVAKKRVETEKENFQRIFDKEHPDYKYLEKSDIEIVINKIGAEKEIAELLDDSFDLPNTSQSTRIKKIKSNKKEQFSELLEILKEQPRFPFNSSPREYQKEAYAQWLKKDKSGVFAMATGTGKTITSLNCLLEEYQESGSYYAIILVPTNPLLKQWSKEVDIFNFKEKLIVGSSNWKSRLTNYVSNFDWGIRENLIIISTYASFTTEYFQSVTKKIQSDFLLIADEAHNMGAAQSKRILKSLNFIKKIGLSATPERIYDQEGTQEVNLFFNDKHPYCYNFGMEKAIGRFLTRYFYYPKLVELSHEEFEKYVNLSKELIRYFDFTKGKYKDTPYVQHKLRERKNLINKATQKKEVFVNILEDLKSKSKLKYTFVYSPAGTSENDDQEEQDILEQLLIEANKRFPSLKMNSYTQVDSDLDDILKGFSEGRIDLLFAKNMLDEGVDVPRAEVGIFASSTGNPRQFIQRRGRLLRKHEDKDFALIYDMIVIPQLSNIEPGIYSIERNLVLNEMRRVAHFAKLSENYFEVRDDLEYILNKYEINLATLIDELDEQ